MKGFSVLAIMLASALTLGTGGAKRLSIGDEAPPISFSSWVKGTPIRQLQPGTIYVFDFWATWCGPCNRAMPHLSEIAKKYAGKVQVVGVDCRENDHNQVKPGKDLDAMVAKFVQDKGGDMAYNVCTDSTDKFMFTNWVTASGGHPIPCAFVIDGRGKVADIVLGYGPGDTRLDDAIQQLLAGRFDYAAARKGYDEELGKLGLIKPPGK